MGNRLTENLTTPGDAYNRAYQYAYDARGNLTHWSEATTGLHLNYHYDEDGNLARAFTDLGFDPDQQNTGNDPAFRFVDHIYLYDRAGRPLQLSQGSTLVSGYGYDAAGNRSYWNNAGTEVTYAYDANGRVVEGSWNNGADRQAWTYDRNGNVLSFRQTGAQSIAIDNVYDELNRNTRTTRDGQVTERAYDVSGRLTRMTLKDQGKTYTYDYSYFGDGREQSVRAFGDAYGNSTSSYDANKNRIDVNQGQGDGQSRPETKALTLDNDGHIVHLEHDDGKSGIRESRDYVYANGHPTGETGHGPDTATRSTVLDAGRYNLVQNLGEELPAAAVTSYTVRAGDTLQSIAAAVYGNPSLWFVIADANGLNAGDALKEGTRLTIPNNVKSGALTNDTHRLYNESDILGSTLPNLKVPPPPKKKGCSNIIAIIIVVVIAIVVAFVTAGVGLAAIGALYGAAAGASIGAAIGAAGLLVTTAVFAVTGAVVAAIGNIVQQGLFIALGYQEEFSWKAVGSAAIAGAFSGAATVVGAAAQIAQKAGESATYLRVATAALKVTGAASSQLISNGKITSWTSLAAAALGSTRTGLNESDVLEGFVSDKALGYVTPWLGLAETYVRNDGRLAPADWANAVGSTLGNAVSGNQAGQLENATNRLAVNAFVGGALSFYDKDAAQRYIENSIGNEVGQYLGTSLGQGIKQTFFSDHLQSNLTALPAYIDKRERERQAQQLQARGLSLDRATGTVQDAYGNPVAAGGAGAAPAAVEPESTAVTAVAGRPAQEAATLAQEPATSVTVRRGDTLGQIIADKYGVGYSEELILKIAALNGLDNPHAIQAGQSLILPELGSDLLLSAQPSREILANYTAGLRSADTTATPQEQAVSAAVVGALDDVKAEIGAPSSDANAATIQKTARVASALDEFKDAFQKGGLSAVKGLSNALSALEIDELVQLKQGIQSYLDEAGAKVVQQGGPFADAKLAGLGIISAAVETLFPETVLDVTPGKVFSAAGKVFGKVLGKADDLPLNRIDDIAPGHAITDTKAVSEEFKLGFRSTTDGMRESIKGQQILDPFTNRLRDPLPGEVISVDHVFPVAEIKKLDGFSELTVEQQKAIVRDTVGFGNLQPLPRELNSSKGAQTEWKQVGTGANARPLNEQYAADLARRQQEIRAAIQAHINRLQGQ